MFIDYSKNAQFPFLLQYRDRAFVFSVVCSTRIIVRLSLLTMINLNHMREMLLFVCSKMAD